MPAEASVQVNVPLPSWWTDQPGVCLVRWWRRRPPGTSAAYSDCRIRAAVIERHYSVGMSLDAVARHPVALVEFPADDPEQALRFWVGVLGVDLQERETGEGDGWQTHSGQTELGVHRRGAGPGDRFSLPYFSVPDLSAALRRVEELGGSVIHPRPPWAICRDSEGNPFALMAAQQRQRAQ
ncbi:MAG TPA: VOC family protein [Pseudonocardiaceae bacterium]|jgi:predicted enzyme related to lactoylglutathione lyase|nr:VOC family protein [Pseudonocardiaceae bacterium]